MKNISNMYDVSILPDQYAINSVAGLYDSFEADGVDFELLLSELKSAIVGSGILLDQDYQRWFLTEGMDYFYNPKLFAYAPLNCVCIFLSELFKRFSLDEISKHVPEMVIKCALSRLSDFKHRQLVS
ncbi:hypothetical protein [Psychromonas sp.]|uniref:hypothetical protein n=1 Tax=Psychromonas sp. TaxID=1884585 RepID=UPI0035660756